MALTMSIYEITLFLFIIREWRGVDPSNAPPFSGQNYLTEEEMAGEISEYPPGSVTHLYLTSDGGLNLGHVFRSMIIHRMAKMKSTNATLMQH